MLNGRNEGSKIREVMKEDCTRKGQKSAELSSSMGVDCYRYIDLSGAYGGLHYRRGWRFEDGYLCSD